MKKLLALLLVLLLTFSLVACGNGNNTNHRPCVLFKIPRGGNFF